MIAVSIQLSSTDRFRSSDVRLLAVDLYHQEHVRAFEHISTLWIDRMTRLFCSSTSLFASVPRISGPQGSAIAARNLRSISVLFKER